MKYILLLTLFLAGCSESIEVERTHKKECRSAEDKKLLASFILKCAEAANPKSDEEGEDLVIQCEMTGANIYCPKLETCRTVHRNSLSGITLLGDWGVCE